MLPAMIVGAVLGTLLLAPLDISETIRAVAAVDLWTLFLVLVLSLVNYAFRFWRWTMFLGGRNAPVSVGRHLAIYVAGFALTATPGKAGETMRSLYLRPFGIPPSKSLAAFYAERLLDLIVISALAMLLITHSDPVVRALGLTGAVIAMGLLAMQYPRVTALVEGAATAWPARGARFASAAAGFLRDVRAMMTPRIALCGTLLGLAAWAGEGLGTYLVVRSMGFDIDLSLAVGIYATAMIAGVLSFLPGGLGGTEVVMTSLLIYAGASAPVAVAATIVVRLATLWFAVVLGLGAWLGLEAARGLKPRE
ncbi:lysylphosphatidylglycerol synthase transmembrane domain-containing protein [Chelativorans salis]|uniref:Flippase-like domain-containing protein n=1 Tax=Chelativorans salis TaxID=2978478 RepID=A0ABT2LKJ9_9HYPH|nr:lysylphosphatidylglycerol synthase transmembrane domain-containing protein [Chelativorans sp. EGI FJ00035]MCT7373714.1 flippase-like domain-containing protein [Chelativorans sp. EGI FJ00035]